MKVVVILVAALLLAPVTATGQGQFVFDNRALPDVNARFVLCTDPPGTSSVSGDQYHVQLLVGPYEVGFDPSQAIASWMVSFRTGLAAGYVNPATFTVPGMFGEATVLVRAYRGESWDTSPVRYEGVFLTPLGVAPGPPGMVPLGTSPLVLCAPGPPPDDGLDRWTWHGTVSSDLNGVTYGNGRFVVVGSYSPQGGILVSDDGHHWTRIQPPATNDLRRVAFGADRFVAVGNAGTILTSPDGSSWARRESGTTNNLAGVGYGAGQYLAVGEGGTILVSPDAGHWAPRDSGLGYPEDFNAVVYGNGTYFIGGYSGLLSSTNTQTWHYTLGFGYLADAVFANGLFGAVERTWAGTFTNAVFWGNYSGIDYWITEGFSTNLNVLGGANLTGVTFGEGKFVAVSDLDGAFVVSNDGTNWVSGKAPTFSSLSSVAYGNGLFVAVGKAGALLTSSDGESWRREAAGNSGWFLSAAYGNSTYVVAGAAARLDDGTLVQRRILSSADGETWTEAPPIADPLAVESQPVHGLAYGNGRFVAVSELEGSSSQVSTNGIDWWASASLPGGNAVAYGNGLFVSVGPDSSRLLGPGASVSEDGLTWTRIWLIPAADTLRAITFSSPAFFAVGDNYAVRFTTDGSWSEFSVGGSSLYGVALNSERAVTVGAAGGIILSPHDPAWSPTTNTLYSVAFGNGRFVAVGANGVILSSSNLVNWVLRNSPTTNDLYAVNYLNGRFLAVGANGTILKSGLPASEFAFGPIQTTASGLQVFIGGDPGQEITIQTSTDLINWRDLLTLARPADGIVLLDRNPSQPFAFYRAILQGGLP
jgi:hypothetical protein